jgi:putative membrane-bound dehydrogenase-like protein
MLPIKRFLMKIPQHSQLFIITSLTLMMSCGVQKEPPPPLTYTGENPRIQNPLRPEESQKHIQLPEGFTASLFASEPDIINPIAFTWDERGRLWVVQSMDYPHELENDVGGDRITICEDTNGDGIADTFTDFATEQSLTTGIVLVKGGAIVAQAPEMAFLQDTDGDDKFDHREVLFDGFGIWDTHAGPSGLRYGPDNFIWGAVGYSGFENQFDDKLINFKMGVFRFSRDGRYFEPWGQFNNNTWGLGINEEFEVFGSTANNNHCCYVGIPLRHYEYLNRLPSWAVNADFIQGHYEISPVDTIPLQQVDVRGGYTAAAGANFYTARNYPQQYWNQMYVNEPTGHLVHIARIEDDGAGYKEVDGGNIFASTDAWTAPVFTETGPDGNLWVADWYNPVIQHNPDIRGMENQIWNANEGPGNAHLNSHRDKRHGRIYIIRHKDSGKPDITRIDPNNPDDLIKGLKSDNMFWRTTAQRLIVEGNKQELIPQLEQMAATQASGENSINAPAVHALWCLDGLQALNRSNVELVEQALSSNSSAVKRAGLALLPDSESGSDLLAKSGLLMDKDLHIRLAAVIRASELPETEALYQSMKQVSSDPLNLQDKWLAAAIKVYHREPNQQFAEPDQVRMIMSSGENQKSQWSYTETQPEDNWYSEGFDHSGWSKGLAPFGNNDSENAKTPWLSSDIWLRKTVNLQQAITEPILKIMHNDDYSVYVNGQLLVSENGVSKEYKYLRLDPEAAQLFKKGENLIAIHCHDNGGDRYIAAGIGVLAKPKADVVFEINTVDQKMAYDKTILKAQAGQTVEIVLRNKDFLKHLNQLKWTMCPDPSMCLGVQKC